ncbi:MAG TPA: hypothetical protein DD435_03600 [Cyanobacteria bacterium UBA8530]|nr:hypothetical protein [Cyanobacteria bacterium UBA8530]
MVENQADYVSAALNGVRNTAIEAAILVMLVIYLFLGSWRQVLVVLLALPTTLILNFGIMKLLGFSLNIFSLGGLVIAISVVLDNSIIVLENIVRLRRKLDESEVEEFAISGTTEVGPAIIAATVSFLALFVPFLLVPGLTSLLFRELILVISGIVLVSLLVALTLTPMLSALLLKAPAKETRFERFFDRLTQAYGQYLGSALQKPWRVVGGFFVVLAVAGLLAPGIGGEFLPPMDDGRVVIKVKLPTGAALNETNKILHRIEKLLEGDPLIKSSFTLVGGKVWGLYTYEIANEGEIDLQLVPRHSRKLSTKQYIARLRSKVAKVPIAGGQAMVSQMKIKGLRNLGEADIEMKVRGDDVNKLFGLAKQAAEKMNESAHFTNVYVSLDLSKPEYRIKLDRVRAAELGVSAADLANTLRSLLSGAVPTQFRDGDEYYNVRVMVPESGIRSRQDIENLPLKGSLGDYLRIRDVAEVERAVGPVEILRENQVKEVIVRGDASGVSVGQALSELKALMDQMERPAGYEIQYGGQAQMMGEMQRSALSILFFAVFFAFLVLAVQFNRLKLPALILACVPVSLAGMAYALFLTRLPLGATVLIGALVVTAATINDGVLLFTFADELVEGGRPSFPAVIEAAKIRLRPRLMTTLPIIFGLVPLALNLEEGGDMLQPMAAAAIGGLILVLPVALLLMPCIYLIFTRKGGHPDPKERLVKKIAAKENEL